MLTVILSLLILVGVAQGLPASCQSQQCPSTGASILSEIDGLADPCQDFFQFSCGAWLKKYEIPDDQLEIGAFDALSKENTEFLQQILESSYNDLKLQNASDDVPANQVHADEEIFNKAKNYYDSCRNETLIGGLGSTPLHPSLEALGTIFDNNLNDTKVAITRGIAYLNQFGTTPLFTFASASETSHPEIYSIYVLQSGLMLTAKERYNDSFILEAYEKAAAETWHKISQNFQLPGINSSDDIDRAVASAVNFEKQLSFISNSSQELSNLVSINNPVTITKLHEMAPVIDWDLLISLLRQNEHPVDSLVITSPSYIKLTSALIAKTDIKTIQYHFMNNMILSVIGALSSDLSAPMNNMTLHISGGKTLPSRQDLCIQNTNTVFGQIVGRFYVLANFSQAAKNSVEVLVNRLRRSLEQSIEQLEFFDEITRKVALDKLQKVVQKIGYGTSSPDVMSPDSLTAYYQSVTTSPERFFDNYISYRQWSARKVWELHGQKVDKQVWQLYPYQVNAYYDPLMNEIVFPAGILQPPFYNVLNSDNLNFGAIGVVIGHELTHGFDTSGRLFDGDGKLRSWWTKEAEKKYLERAQCFIDQYSNFTTDGPKNTSLRLNGDFESGEILADNGGMQISYNAWQNSLKEAQQTGVKSQDYEAVGEYTPEQLFFISFGQIWCSKTRPEYAALRINNDPHPPPQWRVNGAVQNSNDFAKAFDCPSGAPMNPEKKCRVW